MREWIRKHRGKSVILAGLLVSGTALAFPWDIDMVNGAALKAFEWAMADATPGRTERIEANGGRVWSGGAVQRPTSLGATAADGSVLGNLAVTRPQGAGAYQDDYVAAGDYAASKGLKNPYEANAALLAKGEKLYQTSCAPCHGNDGGGVGPVTWHDPAKGRNRFGIAAATLWGEKSVLNAKGLTDGEVYHRIRHGYWVGGAEGTAPALHMPGYAVSLTDKERWAVVAFLREKSPAPKPAATEPPPADAGTAPAGATGEQKESK
jgi:mono/diheme cytochrome c family protein